MISYEGLENALKEKGIGKTDLTLRLGISTRTIAKIAKGEKLSKRSMQKIADYLGKDPAVLMREVSENKILQLLREGAFEQDQTIIFLHSGGAGGLFAIDLP